MALITPALLQKFSGRYADTDDVSVQLQTIYIGTAQEIITNYVGYDPETSDRFYDETTETIVPPDVFKHVCLEIASLLQMEESDNLGVNSKSFEYGGSRQFLNVVDYTKYLSRLSSYRAEDTLSM